MSDNIFRLNNYVTDNILNYDEVMTDIYEENKNLKYQNMISLIQKINFKNTTTVIIKQK